MNASAARFSPYQPSDLTASAHRVAVGFAPILPAFDAAAAW